MASEGAYRPKECRVEAATSDQVRLSWNRNDGERRELVLDRSELPTVLKELKKAAGHQSEALGSLDALPLKSAAHIVGLGFGLEADHFRLTAYLEAPDQHNGVEISLKFCRADLVNCVAAMADWLEQHDHS